MAGELILGGWSCRGNSANPVFMGAFHTVVDIENPYALDIYVHDESMEPIELD